MARRASAISINSFAPLEPNVASIQSPSYLTGSTPNASGRIKLPLSLSVNTLPKQYNDNAYVDPDELFTQRTVAEVKAVQIQLRLVIVVVALLPNAEPLQGGRGRQTGGATTHGRVRRIVFCIICCLDLHNESLVNATVTFYKHQLL